MTTLHNEFPNKDIYFTEVARAASRATPADTFSDHAQVGIPRKPESIGLTA